MIMNAPLRPDIANHAGLARPLDLADLPAEEADLDFSPTLPPPAAVDAQPQIDAPARAPESPEDLLPPGLTGLRAALIDVGSMACVSSWGIGEGSSPGALTQDPDGASCSTAMATIVHLNGTPFELTLTRQLDPQHWAFAWRVDEHNVAVAEARYRAPSDVRSETDIAKVRLLCTAGLSGAPVRRLDAMHGPVRNTVHDARPALRMPRAATRSNIALRVATLARQSRSSPWASIALVGATCVLAALQIQSSREAEAQRFRALADAAMVQQLTRVMAAGDYGEVQADLEAYAGLGYFKGAVVVDARRRAVASAGAVPALRIGHALAAADAADARALPLKTAAAHSDVQLLMWGADPASSGAGSLGEISLFAAGGLLSLSGLAGGLLWWRQRRRQRGPAGAL